MENLDLLSSFLVSGEINDQGLENLFLSQTKFVATLLFFFTFFLFVFFVFFTELRISLNHKESIK